MISISRIGARLQRFFEAMAKARVNSVLLGMDRKKLAQMGYSYELLCRGPSAWPWRETTQDSASKQGKTTVSGASLFAGNQASGSRATGDDRNYPANYQLPGPDSSRDAA